MVATAPAVYGGPGTSYRNSARPGSYAEWSPQIPPNYAPNYAPNYSSDGRGAGKRAKSPDPDFDGLFRAMRASRRGLRVYRERRLEAVREYVGGNYSDGGTGEAVVLNLVARYVQVISRSLVPSCPRVMLSTDSQADTPAVSAMQDWVNARIKAMHFDQTLQRWVIDALFTLGVMKVAIGTPADSAVHGYAAPAGVPFADTVDLDDFAFDLGCRDFRQAGWAGHRYRVPLDVAAELDYFDRSVRKQLTPSPAPGRTRLNESGDERIGAVGRGYEESAYDDFEPMVDLWEVYVARRKRVYTFASEAGGLPAFGVKPLRVQDWIGPGCGPYHYLSLMPVVPGNAIAGGPVKDLVPLAQVINHGYRKLIRQMQRQKEVLPVRGGQVDDARQLVQAADGEAFSCDNADSIKAVSYGGPNQVNANFTVHLSDVFNRMAGNLDLLSGAAKQSNTASQDKLLNENAGAGVADMQEATVAGIARVMEGVCWFWWNHPQEVMTTSRTLAGLPDVGLARKLRPAASPEPGLKRTGRFEDLDCRVDPYSLVHRTPQQRLQFLLSLFDKFAPLLPMLAPAGIHMDLQYMLKKVAEYADEPDVVGLFTLGEPREVGQQGGDGGGVPKPSETTRNYNRTSQGSDTEASRYNDIANAGREAAAEQQ